MTIPGTGPRFHQPERRHVDGSLVASVLLGVLAVSAAVWAVVDRAWVLLALVVADVLLLLCCSLLFAIWQAVESLPRRSSGPRARTAPPTAAGVPLPPRSSWPWST